MRCKGPCVGKCPFLILIDFYNLAACLNALNSSLLAGLGSAKTGSIYKNAHSSRFSLITSAASEYFPAGTYIGRGTY